MRSELAVQYQRNGRLGMWSQLTVRAALSEADGVAVAATGFRVAGPLLTAAAAVDAGVEHVNGENSGGVDGLGECGWMVSKT